MVLISKLSPPITGYLATTVTGLLLAPFRPFSCHIPHECAAAVQNIEQYYAQRVGINKLHFLVQRQNQRIRSARERGRERKESVGISLYMEFSRHDQRILATVEESSSLDAENSVEGSKEILDEIAH